MAVNTSIRQAIFRRGQQRWARCNSSTLIGRLLRPLFGGDIEAVVFVEHEKSDLQSLDCHGDVLAAWQTDESGFASIDPSSIDPGPVAGDRWKKQLFRFHIASDNSKVILNEMEGPERGLRIHFKVWKIGGGVKLICTRMVTESPWVD